MKKALSVILCAVMLLCCIPFAVNAASTVEFTTNGKFTASNQLESKVEYIIKAGVTMEVPSDMTLYIPSGATLRVQESAKLNVLGQIVVLDGGSFFTEGFVYGASNISINGNATAKAAVRFPALDKQGGHIGEDGNAKIKVSWWSSKNGNIYEDQQVDMDAVFEPVDEAGATIWADLNQYFYVRAQIIEPELGIDKYDDSLLNVYFNGVGVPFTQGTHHTLLTTSGSITYSKFSENDLLNTFNIYLPTGEGYTVYGREGEQSADGETVKLKYGQSFSFKVEIDPEYDMSTYEVYIYNGYGWTDLDTETLLKDIAPAKPDDYGYYHIDKIQGEHTIYVVGVVKNETLLMVGDILSMVKNVFEMITAFFQEIAALFGISLGGSAA